MKTSDSGGGTNRGSKSGLIDGRDAEYLEILNEWHVRSGLSFREVAQICDLDPTYVHYILRGARKPQRDVIIALGFAYRLERIEVDEILLLVDLPPLGRSAIREYRRHQVCKSS